MSRVSMALMSLAFCLLSSAALAAPESLTFPTRTGYTKADLLRIAALAEAVEALSQKLAGRLALVPPDLCALAQPCTTVAFSVVVPLRDAAHDLASLARSYPHQAVSDEFMEVLRTGSFNKVAALQHDLHKSYLLVTSGSALADFDCADLLDVYWVLLNQVVMTNRPLSGNEGRGLD